MSLRLHLVLLVVICMLPAVALLAMNQVKLREAREAEVRHAIVELAESDAGEIARVIEGGKQLLTALEQAPAIRERNGPLCSALLLRLRQEYPSYASIVATDPAGRSFCSSNPGRADFEGDQAYFRAAIDAGGFVVGSYAVSPLTHTAVLPMARPVITSDGTMLGVLVLSLDLDSLAQELATKLPNGTALTLVGGNDIVLLHVPDAYLTAGQPLPPELHASPPADAPPTADVPGNDKVVRIVATVPAGNPAYGLRILAARDQRAAFAALDATTRSGVTLIVAGLVIALLLAGLIAWRFIQLPVRELLHTAEQLRRGDYARRTRLTTVRSELGRIGLSLNALAFALTEREEQRHFAEAQLLELANTLENRVEERTQELATANARLAAEAEERQRAQAALAQAQKLDAIGQLTGGVAHDFNNLLAAILGALEVAGRRTEDPRTARLLAIAQQAAERGAKLTAHMLAFSRKQDLALRPVNVNEVIEGMSDMLGRTIGPMIQMQHDLADDLWWAIGDPVQLEVALLNLAVNARDAMPDGGALTFRSRNVHVSDDADGLAALASGTYAMITVSDTGQGMPADIQARVFEPFFTTKGAGKGTGLGLSMVYGFARQAGGGVMIDSQPGKGTTISIYLPRATEVVPEPADVPEAATELGPLHILLVDDDEDVRSAVHEMLRDLGHDATEAEGGPAALEMLRGSREFDLLLVDFAMPEMTGVQLAQTSAALRPTLPVLLMTGYAEGADRRSWSGHDLPLVMKPFSSVQLAAALTEALAASETTTH